MSDLRQQIHQLNEYMSMSDGWRIFRRYFVMNAFDGILSVFGVVISAFFLGVQNPQQIILPGAGAASAIGVSGIWIALLTEQAEQEKKIQHMENIILTDLGDTQYARAQQVSGVINSVANGLSPFFFGLLSLVPFFFAETIGVQMSYFASFGISVILLFVLGLFLARIASQNRLVFGLKTVTAGLIVAIIVFLMGI